MPVDTVVFTKWNQNFSKFEDAVVMVQTITTTRMRTGIASHFFV